MTTYGVTPQGFVAKTLDDSKSELEDRFRAAFGQSINLGPKSLFGQLIGIQAEREADLWNLAQDVYNQGDPDGATGDGMDNISAITGTIREYARPSRTVLTLTGSPGTGVPGGKQASVTGVGTKFFLDTGALLNAVTAYTSGATVNLYDRMTAGGQVYQCNRPGVTGATPPSGTGNAITTGGTEQWEWLGAGTAAADVSATCTVNGPTVAKSGTVTTIETPVSGWQGVFNVFDALLGALVEDDPTLRVRRAVELFGDANATLAAIRERVLRVGENTDNPVLACNVFQNVTMMTDALGLPPKSVEVLCDGGVDADIGAAIFSVVAGGIETHGSVSVTVVDPLGNNQTVNFNRPNQLLVYVVANVEVDANLFDATNGPTEIANNIITWALGYYTLGKGVASAAIAAQVWRTIGVINVPLPFIGLAPAPSTSTTIPAAPRDRAVFDSSRITVNITNGSEGNP